MTAGACDFFWNFQVRGPARQSIDAKQQQFQVFGKKGNLGSAPGLIANDVCIERG
jgi:hypothetical protein